MAVALQASAKKAGVEFEVVPGEHTPDFRARKYQVLVGNSGTRLPDPFGTLVQYAYNPDNRDEAKLGGYYLWRTALDAPELTKMVEASKAETDPAKRKDEYKRMQEIYGAEAPLLFLFETPFAVAVSKSIEGYIQTPLGANDFSEAWRAD